MTNLTGSNLGAGARNGGRKAEPQDVASQRVNLPEGWILTKFTEVLNVQGGTQPPKAHFINEPQDGYIRLLQIRDFGAKPFPTFIPDTSKIKKCDINDLLIGRYGASLGRICTGMEGAYNVALAKVIAGNYLHKPFLKAYLESDMFQQPLALLSRSAQNGFNKDDLSTFDFALIPLAEQKVIADTLETLLAQVETTKARLERIPKILKTFRQSVLAAAVSGKLTEEWRGCASYLSSEHMESWGWFGVPASWAVELYSELTESRLGKMLDKSKNTGLPTKYLGNINVRWFDFELSNLQEILISEKELLELKVKYDDVLICEGGEPGRCAIWKYEKTESIIYQKALHRARVGTKLLPEWLAYNLKNDADSLKLNQLFTGTTIKHLTGKALKRYPIRVPSIEEQTEIVHRVEELFAFADRIEQKVNAALERVNNLTQSILAQAFRGELTADWRAQNPDLISGDNSAEALLEKIKAEREALSSKKKPKKKTAARKKA